MSKSLSWCAQLGLSSTTYHSLLDRNSLIHFEILVLRKSISFSSVIKEKDEGISQLKPINPRYLNARSNLIFSNLFQLQISQYWASARNDNHYHCKIPKNVYSGPEKGSEYDGFGDEGGCFIGTDCL